MTTPLLTPGFLWLVLICAGLTYGVRAAGYLVLARFERVPPRLEAMLDAVPAAVLTTLFAPALLYGVREAAALALAAALAWRFGALTTVCVTVVFLIAIRQIG